MSWLWLGIHIQTKFLAYSFLHYLHLNSDVEDVHEMMDDIQEQTELADEISRAISEPAGFGMDVDEVRRGFALCRLKQHILGGFMLQYFYYTLYG